MIHPPSGRSERRPDHHALCRRSPCAVARSPEGKTSNRIAWARGDERAAADALDHPRANELFERVGVAARRTTRRVKRTIEPV